MMMMMAELRRQLKAMLPKNWLLKIRHPYIAFTEMMAVDLSFRLGWIDEPLVKRVQTILKEARLPVAPPESMTVEMFKSLMAVDKKVADGVMRLVLLKGPLGNSVSTGDYDRAALDQTLQAFCKT